MKLSTLAASIIVLALGATAVEHQGLSFGGALSLLATKVEQRAYPMPLVSHIKKAGHGYAQGSPLYDKQEAWVAVNGNNTLLGPLTGEAWGGIPEIWRPFWVAYSERPLTSVLQTLLTFLIWVFLAWIYIKYKHVGWAEKSVDKKKSPSDGFLHWPFSPNCAHDWQLCLCAMCCPGMRWADTVSQLESEEGAKRTWTYWKFFFLFAVLYILAPLTLGLSLSLMACIGIAYRQQMREKFGHHPGVFTSKQNIYGQERHHLSCLCFLDVLLWCFFPCCAIAQEAREIEQVQPAIYIVQTQGQYPRSG